jgi:hypothetical protein
MVTTPSNTIPSIRETEEDKKLSTFDLKTKYRKIYQSHFQGDSYLNKDTGIIIFVSSDSVRQWGNKVQVKG